MTKQNDKTEIKVAGDEQPASEDVLKTLKTVSEVLDEAGTSMEALLKLDYTSPYYHRLCLRVRPGVGIVDAWMGVDASEGTFTQTDDTTEDFIEEVWRGGGGNLYPSRDEVGCTMRNHSNLAAKCWSCRLRSDCTIYRESHVEQIIIEIEEAIKEAKNG